MFNIFYCFFMFIKKHFTISNMHLSESTRCYNVIPSLHYFYKKTKIADFQICISVPLNIDVLIGLDKCCYFIYGTVIRGKSYDPIALELTLGWIISGSYSINNEKNVYNVGSHFLFVPPSLFNWNYSRKRIV